MPRRLSGLPAPHAGRRATSTPTSTTSACASGSRSRPASSAPSARRRRLAGDARHRRGRATTARCWSPTATTGTRAGRSRRSRAPTFDGRADALAPLHRATTRSCSRGKRVVVLGMGNSAMDIAVEASQTAERVFLAARRGAWIVPKYVFGRPLDQLVTAPRIPLRGRASASWQTTLRAAVGDMERYGLPKPDHRSLEAHPTISGHDPRPASRTATSRPSRTSRGSTSDSVVFADGSRGAADVVVYGTGYKVSFPFFDPAFVAAPDNDLPLYRRVFHPDLPGLYFIALLQPLGATMPLAEAQSEWICDHLTRPLRAAAAGARCCADIARERAAMRRATSPPSATRCRSTSTTTCSSCGASASAARSGREPARGDQGGQPRGAAGRRPRGLRRARLRRGDRRARRRAPHGPRLRHVLQLLRQQGRDLRAPCSRRSAARPARGCARPASPRARRLPRRGLRRVLRLHRGRAGHFAFLDRNAEAVARRPRSTSCARTSRGRLRDGVDVDYTAHAMVAVGLQIGRVMLTREPVDVDEATRFCSRFVPRGPSLAWLRDAFPFHTSRRLRARAGAAVHRLGRLHGRDLRERAVDVRRPAVPGGGLQAGTGDRRLRRRARPAGRRVRPPADYLAAAQAQASSRSSPSSTRAATPRGCDQKKFIGKGICKLPSQKAYETRDEGVLHARSRR